MRGRSSLLTALACLSVGLSLLAVGLVADLAGLLALGGLTLGFAAAFAASALVIRSRVRSAELTADPQGEHRHILVPLKWGDIGDEVLIAALRLAEEHQAKVTVLHVVQVARELPLDAHCAEDDDAEGHISKARAAAEDVGVAIEAQTIHARDRGHAICQAAREQGCDLIVMGSSARWRRQSRLLSPAADYVVRHADCQVMVVSYPDQAFVDALPA